MAFTLNNLIGFETNGLEEASSVANAPIIQSGVVNTGGFALQFDNVSADQYFVEPFEGFTSDAGDQYAIGFAFRTDDLTVTANYALFRCTGQGSNQISLAVDGTTAELVLLDNGLSEVGRSTPTLSVDTWHYIEVYWENADSAVAEVFLDGVQVISVTAQDFFLTGAYDTLVFEGTTANAHNIYFDDVYCASGLTAASELLGPSEVIPYRSSKNSVTPDDGGADLDIGTWLAVQTIPFDVTIGAEYTASGAAGAVDCDDVGGSAGTGGPATDTNAADAINGVKAIMSMERGGGGPTDHFILLGNDADGTTRSADLDPAASQGIFFFVSEAATIVPLSSEVLRVGFENTAAQDFECYDMLAQILHTPSTVDPDITATSIEAFGQTADINAVGEMGASSSMAYAAVADINAPGALDATSLEAYAAAGAALDAAGELRATSVLNFAKLNADLRAIGLISATSVEDFSEVPDINAPGKLEVTSLAIVESYGVANQDNDHIFALGDRGGAQSFNGVQGVLKSVEFYLNKDGTPAGNMKAVLWAHANAFGSSGVPTGLALAVSAEIVADSVGTSKALIRFEFSDGFELQSGTDYFIELDYTDGGFSGNRIFMGVDTSSPTHPGNFAEETTTDGNWDAIAAADAIFILRTDAGVAFGSMAHINAPKDIAATSPLIYGEATAILNALGELTITATLVYSENPDINAPGTMAATSTELFDDAGADLQPGASNDITATSPETFAAAADINAPGAMTADASLAYSEVPDINAVGEIAASASEVYAATADINAPGEMAATSPLTYAELNATLNALGELTITATLVYGATADINAPGEMTGSSSELFDDAGADLQGVASNDMLATSPLIYGEANATLNGAGELTITATLVYSENPDINAPGTLDATSTELFDDAGADLQGVVSNDMTATSLLAFGASAVLDAIAEILATSTLTYGATAVLSAIGEMTITSALGFSEAGADLDAVGVLGAASGLTYAETQAALTALGELAATSPELFAAMADLQGIGDIVESVFAIILESALQVQVLEADLPTTTLEG